MNNRRSVATLAMLAMLALPLIANAQVVAPTPTPDPHVYDDPAMHYVAPANSIPLGEMQNPTLATLSQDPTTVARWGLGRTEYDARMISISMELYSGSLDGFDSQYENALREADPATIVKNKELVQLSNGMPAYFLEVTQGAGFASRKIFAYIWIDSQRGVVLSVGSGLGVVDEDTAKQLLAGATAVRYPTGTQ